MPLKVSVTGTDEVITRLNKFNRQTSSELKVGMRKILVKLRRDAKALAPVKTKFLKKNIVFINKPIRQGVEGVLHSKAPYSVYQEFGTKRHSAQPFMTPAFNGNIDFIKRQLRVSVVNAIISTSRT